MLRYIIFASAGFSLLMYSIDTEAVAVAFPSPQLLIHVWRKS